MKEKNSSVLIQLCQHEWTQQENRVGSKCNFQYKICHKCQSIDYGSHKQLVDFFIKIADKAFNAKRYKFLIVTKETEHAIREALENYRNHTWKDVWFKETAMGGRTILGLEVIHTINIDFGDFIIGSC